MLLRTVVRIDDSASGTSADSNRRVALMWCSDSLAMEPLSKHGPALELQMVRVLHAKRRPDEALRVLRVVGQHLPGGAAALPEELLMEMGEAGLFVRLACRLYSGTVARAFQAHCLHRSDLSDLLLMLFMWP